jgi:nucleoside-diphosphate-sugar epimerase
MVNVLVTGGAGFIGSHIADELVAGKNSIRILDDLSTGSLLNIEHLHGTTVPCQIHEATLHEHLEGKIEFINGDVSKKEDVEKAMDDIDYVFHEAAFVSVSESFKYPAKTWDVNIKGTKLLLNAAEKLKVKRFVFASSAAVYGNSPKLPKKEDMSGAPTSPYGNSKSMAEIATIESFKKFKLKSCALRYFNVYGPRQSPSSEYSGVITKFLDKMIHGERPTIYGDGEQTRDFVYVDDVVSANMLVMERKEAIGEVFNVGTGKQITLNALVDTINELLDKKIEPIYEPVREGDIRYSYADISKARKMIGFEPKYSLKEGLEKTISWFKNSQKNINKDFI